MGVGRGWCIEIMQHVGYGSWWRLRRGVEKAARAGLESLFAMVGAEVDAAPFETDRGRSMRDLYLHATHWVDRVAASTTKTLAVSRQHPDRRECTEKDEIEDRGVVPREVCGGYRPRPRGRDDARGPENSFGDQPRD